MSYKYPLVLVPKKHLNVFAELTVFSINATPSPSADLISIFCSSSVCNDLLFAIFLSLANLSSGGLSSPKSSGINLYSGKKKIE